MHERDALIREQLDASEIDAAALRLNLRDIRRINTLLGWTAFTTWEVARHIRSQGLSAFALLDVASGSADIPLAIARWSRRAGVSARIVATDINPTIVAIAREQGAGMPGFSAERHNALNLPYDRGSFDIALCTLALHHFDPDQAVGILQNMARVGKQMMVFDIARSRLAYYGAVALTSVLGMHPMTRHDAPASVRRSYNSEELRALARRAGLSEARVWVGFPFRLALSAPGNI